MFNTTRLFIIKIIPSITGIILGFIVINKRLFINLARYFTNLILTPEELLHCSYFTYTIINNLIGFLLIAFSTFMVVHLIYKDRVNLFFKKNYLKILYFIIFFLIITGFWCSMNITIEPDEIEHIHSSWYVSIGCVPYADFFQHHHPLLWYITAPFILILKQTAIIIIIFRIVMNLLKLSIVYITYRIARLTGLSREINFFISAILLSTIIFVKTGTEVRPDIPQVLFSLISLLYFIRFYRFKKYKYFIISALSASVSILFLQKAVFLLALYALIFIYGWYKKKISFSNIILYSIFFCIPVLIFFLYMTITQSFDDYLITNFLVSVSRGVKTENGDKLRFFIHNGMHGLLSLISTGYFIFYWKRMDEIRNALFIIGMVLLVYPFVLGCTAVRYFFFCIPIVCIVIGYFVESFFKNNYWSEKKKIVFLIIIIIIPSLFLVKGAFINYNKAQLEKIDYVLNNSEKSDLVYDGSHKFNLFRRDVHYFWFQLGMIDDYNRMTSGRYKDYDIYSIIEKKRPKYISDYRIDVTDSLIVNLYERTPYKNLFVIKD